MIKMNEIFPAFGKILFLTAFLAIFCIPKVEAVDEYRAFWVDAWGAGARSQTEVNKLLGVVGDPNSKGDIRNANCNAVIVQVRRRADVCYPSAMGENYFTDLVPSDFNALQAVINAAHDTTGGKQRIEVHAWIVTFATSHSSGTSQVYYDHNNPSDPDNYWMTLDDGGNETGDKALDPGHPKCLEYLTNVCMDLVTNFDIDGIHYDYIRFTGANQGYNPISIARYNARYGLTGQPLPSDEQFKQWRRDQVTALVRKVYAKIQAVKPNVKQSASFVTWNPSPVDSTREAFKGTRPYYDVYSDWDSWIQEGIVDVAVPMTYYNKAALPTDYQRWMNFEKDRKGNRHMVVGPGIYLNYLQEAIDEILMIRDPSPAGNYAHGFSGYSYRCPYSIIKVTTNNPPTYGTWANFAPQLISQVTPTPANIPSMPWKSNPTKGHISGTVTYAGSGAWADGALVTLAGPESRSQECDGTGFYAFIDLTPGTYTVTVSKEGYPSVQSDVNVSIGTVTGNMYVTDFVLGTVSAPPVISGVQAINITNNGAMITWNTDQNSSSKVEYGLTPGYGSTTPIDNTQVTSHAVTLSGLSPNTTYHLKVISTNTNGTSTSADYTFTTLGPPSISNVRTNVAATSANVTWDLNASADGRVSFGTTAAYGSQTVSPRTGTTHTVSLTSLTPNTTYHFQCVSTNSYGTAQSSDYTFTTLAANTETIVDNTDSGWSNTSPNGNAWNSGATAGVPKIGSNYLYYKGDGSLTESTVTRKCRWTPGLSTTGIYDVYVYYQIGANRNQRAPYTVYYNGGQVSGPLDQYSPTPNQGGWFLVGQNLPFITGTSGYVELTTLSTDPSYVSADAAKWVLKSTDVTPPIVSGVTDEKYTISTTSLQASWNGSDPQSGILRYEYAVGSGPGLANVRSWTSAGTATSTVIDGLPLMVGNKYYITVRAVNGVGLTGSPSNSAGVTVAQSLSSIAQAKSLTNNKPVAFPVFGVSAAFANMFYIQDTDNISGIRIDSAEAVTPNQIVQVFGMLNTIDGRERVLTGCKVIPGAMGTTIKPFFMPLKSVGGRYLNAFTPGITAGVGLNNIGLLASVFGRITARTSDGFYIDDGSGLKDALNNTGLFIYTGTSGSASSYTWTSVTGAISCRRMSDDKIYPMILSTGIMGF